jgi:hypothetical protein
MYQYSFNGQSPENREKAFGEVEELIRNHGSIVAFSRSSESSINLMVEVAEDQAELLIHYLETEMFSDSKPCGCESDDKCKILINLRSQN